jgi:hypothetical protein
MRVTLTTFLIPFLFTFIIINSSIAQNDLNDQLKKIDGTVDKITVTADGKVYTFEGSDAEDLFKKMKSDKSQNFVWNSSDDSKNKKVIILDADGDEDAIEVESVDDNVYIIKSGKDLSDIDEGLTKKVNIKIDDGEKTVTVTTKENGEENTKVYTGKEADEYIEKMKSENGDFDIQIDSEKDGKKVKKIIIETEETETD